MSICPAVVANTLSALLCAVPLPGVVLQEERQAQRIGTLRDALSGDESAGDVEVTQGLKVGGIVLELKSARVCGVAAET